MTELCADPDRSPGTMLAVRLGHELLALPISAVEEVLPALPIESVPNCPSFIRGVVFVRGHLIPVLDAAERLGLTQHQRPLEPHIVCLKVGDRIVGVEFDEAVDLMELGRVEALTSDDIGVRAGFFCGVVEWDGHIIRLLDPDGLLQSSEAAELTRVPRTSHRRT